MNKTILKELIFDILKQNEITFKELARDFFISRVRNQNYREAFIRGLEEELKTINVVDSRDYHEDLFKDL